MLQHRSLVLPALGRLLPAVLICHSSLCSAADEQPPQHSALTPPESALPDSTLPQASFSPRTLGSIPDYKLELASVGGLPQRAWLSRGLMAPSPDPEPSTGLGHLITGWIFVGAGGAELLFGLPACALMTNLDDSLYTNADDVQTACFATVGVMATVFLAVGIPLVVIGSQKRKKYKAWQQRTSFKQHLGRTSFVPLEGGGSALYSVRF